MDEFDTVGLGRHRETAKWAAAAIVDDFENQPEGPISALVSALDFKHGSKSLKNLVRKPAANRLGSFADAAPKAIPSLLQTAGPGLWCALKRHLRAVRYWARSGTVAGGPC